LLSAALLSAVLWEWRTPNRWSTSGYCATGISQVAAGTMFVLGFSPGGIAVIVLMQLGGHSVFEDGSTLAGCFQINRFSDRSFRDVPRRLSDRLPHRDDARVVQSMGMAFLFVPLNTIAFSSIAEEKANNATGLINLARNIGGSPGIAMVATILLRRSPFHQSMRVSHVNSFNNAYRAILDRTTHLFVNKGSDPVDAVRRAGAGLSLSTARGYDEGVYRRLPFAGSLVSRCHSHHALIRRRQHS
jgi:hypothetical protein